jgi:2-methylcitrate dehydratase PrpD
LNVKETIRFVEQMSAIEYGSLSEPAIEMAGKCLLDYIGCTFAGLSYESSRIVREYALENYTPGNCTIIGSKRKLVPAGACYTNGTTGHAVELDDCTNEGGGHPAVTIMPAVLAMAEETGAGGRDVLTAITVGYETFIKIGKASNYQSLFVRGFHPTALLGMFGATMAASRLLGLNVEKATNAMGIVGSYVSGNLECYTDGSYTKRLHGGTASSAGVTAALLAKKGYTGPRTILEGPRGFFHAYCTDPRVEELFKKGAPEIERVSFKPHACCRFNQAGIDAVLELSEENRMDWRRIRSILIELAETPYNIVGQPREIKFNPKSAVDGQFSAPYSVAIACIEKRAFLEEYTEESIQRPDVLECMKKITTKHSPDLDRFFPESFPTKITITMEDEETYTREVRYPKGDPENPLSWNEILEKFDRCMANASMQPEKLGELIEHIRNLENVRDMKKITALLC